jgi:hypothetical protein
MARSLVRPRTNNTCRQKPNPSRETVPVSLVTDPEKIIPTPPQEAENTRT